SKTTAATDSAKLAGSVSTNDSAKLARSFNPVDGQRGGSTKDPVLAAVTEGQKHGISKRTIERARTKVHATKPKMTPVSQKAVDAKPPLPSVEAADRQANPPRGQATPTRPRRCSGDHL